jgi:cell division protein FtsA
VQRAGVEIDDLVLQPLASGEAVLTADDKDRGVVLVDIGGGTTDIAVFVQGGIWHSSVIPVGGNQFTNDIVLIQQTPHNTAEYLKLKYGAAIAEDPADEASDLIEAEGFAPGERQQISRSMLNQILQARAEEVIELIYNEIRRSGYEGLLPAGVVITGGSAQLPRFDELMRDMLGIPVRVGAPSELTGLSDTIDSPPYATGVGLLRWGARHGMTLHNSPNAGLDRAGMGSAYDRFKGWLREFLP